MLTSCLAPSPQTCAEFPGIDGEIDNAPRPLYLSISATQTCVTGTVSPGQG